LPIEIAARGDAPQPSCKATIAAPLAQRPPSREQCILRNIVAFVAGKPPRIAAKARFMRAHQRAEGDEVAPGRPVR